MKEIQTDFGLLTDRYTQCIQVHPGGCVRPIWTTTAKTDLNISLRLKDCFFFSLEVASDIALVVFTSFCTHKI